MENTPVKKDMPRLDAQQIIARHECLIKIADMVRRANERVAVRTNVSNKVFFTRLELQTDVQKWTYIAKRLEVYYFKKLSQLTSETYDMLCPNGSIEIAVSSPVK